MNIDISLYCTACLINNDMIFLNNLKHKKHLQSILFLINYEKSIKVEKWQLPADLTLTNLIFSSGACKDYKNFKLISLWSLEFLLGRGIQIFVPVSHFFD